MTNPIPLLLNNKYQIVNKIGEGKFGQVFRGKVVRGKRCGESVAIKFDILDANDQENQITTIMHEAKMLHYLNHLSMESTFPYGPQLYWYGVIQDEPENEDDELEYSPKMYTFVMSYYDTSLANYLANMSIMNKQKTIEQFLLDQAFSALRHIHDLFVIHRDIKPSNIMISNGDVRLIDFGMSTFYVDGDGEHLPGQPTKKEIIGSPNFCSPFIHEGWPAARRDDYISMIYVMLDASIDGKLPWKGLPVYADISHKANQDRLQYKRHIQESIQSPKIREMLELCYSLNYNETI